VYWDTIVSIEQVTPSEPWVYDLSIAETHNFVADNIIVHNSNLADAIRWVLGEQSMRLLRGKKSDDVIFAGGQGRATMHMAEVGLVLDNSAAWLPSEYAEVTAARRSFRSGDNEYLLNGQRARLKDVLLLLAQARIGHDSYTVIGQGLVDQALSQRAEERRGLFEDAAGIRQFQAQRNDAEQKLTLTQANLARLHDIVGEIEPRLAPLAEQARRARDYAGTRDELLRLLRIWYRRQWHAALAARDDAQSTETELALRLQKVQDALTVEDALVEDLRRQRTAVLEAIGGVRRERGEASGRLQTIERDLAVARERHASLDRQEADLAAEQEAQADAVAGAEAHASVLEDQLAAAEEQAEGSAATLETLERGIHAARQEQEREEATLRAAQRDVMQVQARLGAAQTELGRLQRQVGERNRALASRRDAVAQAQHKLTAAEARLAEQRAAFESAREAVAALVAQREEAARTMAEGHEEIEQLRGDVADAQRARRAAADRLALLAEWQRSLEGFGGGARALLQAPAQSRPPIVGALAQLVTTRKGMEPALEAALGALLQSVVVATREDALRAAEWLRENGDGHAVLVWLEGEPAVSQSNVSMPTPDGADVLGFARDLVECPPELRPLLARALGDTYVVQELAVAQRLWHGAALPAPIATLTGELLHPRGWLRGGGAAHVVGRRDGGVSSMLARERELRQLPAEIDRLDSALHEVEAQQKRAVEVQHERKVAAEGLRHAVGQAEARAQELARLVAQLQREQERAQNEVTLGETVAEQLAAEVDGIEQDVAAIATRVGEQEVMQGDAAERVEAVQQAVDEFTERHRAQQDEVSHARTALALHRQEAKATGQRAEQLRGQARELQLQMSRREQRLEALRLQREQLNDTITGYEATLVELRETTRVLAEELRTREQRQQELERQVQELERGQNIQRQDLARLEVELQRAVLDARRAEEAREALAAQIREELSDESDADPLAAITGDAVADDDPGEESRAGGGLTADETAKLRRQIDQLRGRIRHLGGYDPDAPAAYDELKTRYDFLSGQVRDMEQAAVNLRGVIQELDATMRRQFEETFQIVNEHFARHFVTLFGGGAARLELVAPRRPRGEENDDEDDDDEVAAAPKAAVAGGVEVIVQIPGKKVQDLSLLSGGERAMVSVALLFALLETNPPPFCLLDEVDAALDEANVMRFCEILKTLAQETQFIVITHNRVTMTHADAIYGISMGGDSVSRVLSMRLAEVATGR
jgi:chromosome segregation protein